MFIGGVHIGARALHVLNLIWFGYIARLSQWGKRVVISSFKWFLPAVATCRGRKGGGSALCGYGTFCQEGVLDSRRMRDIWKLAVKTRLDTVTYTRFTDTLIPSTTFINISILSLDGRQITWFESDTAPAGRRNSRRYFRRNHPYQCNPD